MWPQLNRQSTQSGFECVSIHGTDSTRQALAAQHIAHLEREQVRCVQFARADLFGNDVGAGARVKNQSKQCRGIKHESRTSAGRW